MARKKGRAAAGRRAKEAKIAPLAEIARLEQAVESEVSREVESARHALDRMPFWGGVCLLALSVVLFLNGVWDVTYLSTGLAGVLALFFE